MANPNILGATSAVGGVAGWALGNVVTSTLLEVEQGKILKINKIICANVDGVNSSSLTLSIDNMAQGGAEGVTLSNNNTDVHLAKTIEVPADSTLIISDTPIYLMESNELKGGASSIGDLELFISYEVFDDA